MEVRFDKGIYLAQCELWLDPPETRKWAFVSKADEESAKWHDQTIATPSTLSIIETYVGAANGRSLPIEFQQTKDFCRFRVTLFSLGKVLGSAQAYVESEWGSLLYTRDRGWSSEASGPTWTGQVETLVLETTYGLPKYRFPSTENISHQIVQFCVEALEEGNLPVLMGYHFSKAQEIFAALAAQNLRIALHPTVWHWTRLYEKAGASFSHYERAVLGDLAGCVLICPYSQQGEQFLSTISRKRVAFLGGATLTSQGRGRLHFDAVFPVSDHADYESLMKHVEAVAPRRVFTFNGFSEEFARDLRARGIEAWALSGSNQLEFPLGRRPSYCVPLPTYCAQLERTGFGRFCLMCEQVSDTIGKAEKIRLLQGFFRRLSDPELSRVCVWLTGRIFPRASDYTNQAEGTFIRCALAAASHLSEEEFRDVELLYDDFGLLAEQVLSGQPFRRRMEICDLQAAFMRLADFRDPVTKTEFLANLFSTITPLEAKMIARILVGELLPGIKESLVEEGVAEAFICDPLDIHQANILLGDIGRTAVLARQNRLETAEMTLFRPVPCMLAAIENDSGQVWEQLATGKAFSRSLWLEENVEGLRVQIHTDGMHAKIYTANLQEVTTLFPDIAQAACCLGRPAVFDGVLVIDSDQARLFRLQKIAGREKRELLFGYQKTAQLIIFDILLLDGVSLFRKPLYARRLALDSLEMGYPLRLAAVTQALDFAAAEAEFKKVCMLGKGSLIAKDPTSAYRPGCRTRAWMKLTKRLASLKVVVVGAEYEEHRPKQVCLIFALRRKDGSLITVGRVRNKMSEVEAMLLVEHLEMTTLSRNGKHHEVQPTIVLEITFTSVKRSSRSTSGFILYHPRLKRIREDMASTDIDILDYLELKASCI